MPCVSRHSTLDNRTNQGTSLFAYMLATQAASLSAQLEEQVHCELSTQANAWSEKQHTYMHAG